MLLLEQYGYQLPPLNQDELVYCSVYFKPIGEKLFTYLSLLSRVIFKQMKWTNQNSTLQKLNKCYTQFAS